MNLYILLSLLSVIISVFVGQYVFYLNPRNRVNQTFLGLTTLAALHLFSEFMALQSTVPATALFWIRVGSPWPFILVVNFLFTMYYTGRKGAWTNPFSYALLFASALYFSIWLFLHCTPVMGLWGYSPEYPSFRAFSIWAATLSLGASIMILIKLVRETNRQQRIKDTYVLVALLFPLITGFLDDMHIGKFSFVGLGLTAMGVIIAYAITKYDLFTVGKALKQAESDRTRLQELLIHSEKMAAVGQLAGGVAHEINNPMGVILGFAQALARDLKPDHPLYLPLTSIQREALRCKALVVDLLVFSRTHTSATTATNVNDVIEQTFSLLAGPARVRNVQLIFHLAGDIAPVEANSNQLQQVFLNLANNAMDAMPGAVQ